MSVDLSRFDNVTYGEMWTYVRQISNAILQGATRLALAGLAGGFAMAGSGLINSAGGAAYGVALLVASGGFAAWFVGSVIMSGTRRR
jgi:hypothetical protein